MHLLRLNITFDDFFFSKTSEFLEIGDGLIANEGTRLAHFSGTDLPSNVVTIGNTAWIKVHAACWNVSSTFSVTIYAINETGIIMLLDAVILQSIRIM